MEQKKSFSEERLYQAFEKLIEVLRAQIGLHRQLLDTVRVESQALQSANSKEIEKTTYAKEAHLDGIRRLELDRLKLTTEVSILLDKPIGKEKISDLIIVAQGLPQIEIAQKTAGQLRSISNALKILIERIQSQNIDNQGIAEQSLIHIQVMKTNALGESHPQAGTYSQKALKVNTVAQSSSRLFSEEA